MSEALAPTEAAVELDAEAAARLRAALGRLARLLRPTVAGTAAGLTPTRAAILLRVVRDGRVRMAELAAAEGLNPTMLSRCVAELTADGLVERESDPADRRVAWVCARPPGRRLAERVRRERSDALQAALEELAPAERELLAGSLAALEALADRLAERQR